MITIGDGILHENLRENAKISAVCTTITRGGMVPIVEPEVLMDGDHSADLCMSVTQRTLEFVFAELASAGVNLKGMLLKPNMVLKAQSLFQLL